MGGRDYAVVTFPFIGKAHMKIGDNYTVSNVADDRGEYIFSASYGVYTSEGFVPLNKKHIPWFFKHNHTYLFCSLEENKVNSFKKNTEAELLRKILCTSVGFKRGFVIANDKHLQVVDPFPKQTILRGQISHDGQTILIVTTETVCIMDNPLV